MIEFKAGFFEILVWGFILGESIFYSQQVLHYPDWVGYVSAISITFAVGMIYRWGYFTYRIINIKR